MAKTARSPTPQERKLANEFGEIKAAMAALEERHDACKTKIIKTGLKVIDGTKYRVTVSKGGRKTLDNVAVEKKLGSAWCRRHMKFSPSITVRCGARKRPA